jgi:hypothetical protein
MNAGNRTQLLDHDVEETPEAAEEATAALRAELGRGGEVTSSR